MATNSDRTVKSVTYYQPGPVPIVTGMATGGPYTGDTPRQFGGSVTQPRFAKGYTGDTSLDHIRSGVIDGERPTESGWIEANKVLGEYLRNELKQLGDVLFNQAAFRLERTNAIPDRPRAGDIR